MTIEELFKRLSYGPLSNLSIGSEGTGTIEATKQPKMVSYLNEALLRLHSRFVLIERELIIRQDEAITSYKISPKNSQSYAEAHPESTEVVYIRDSITQPYENDLIKILTAYSHEGCVLPLNDPDHCESLFTPQPNVLQVPKPIQDIPLHLIYQARHAPFALDAALTSEFDLPFVLEGPLASYMSHLVFSHMNGQEHILKAAEHLTAYESACQEVIDMDLVNSSSSASGNKFAMQGWV